MAGWHADFLNHLGNRKVKITHEVHHKTHIRFMNRKLILIRKQQNTFKQTLYRPVITVIAAHTY